MLFAEFHEGLDLGTLTYDIEPELIAQWCSLFGRPLALAPNAKIPLGFLPIIKIRAYMELCPTRPPGNIHGTQSYDVHELPMVGSQVNTQLYCSATRSGGSRNWIEFQTRTRDARTDQLLASGQMTIAWAQ